MSDAYSRLAHRYDLGLWPLERALLGRLRRRPYAAMRGRVLEVGVGTGPSLGLYPPEALVVAADLSLDMLARARERPRRAEVVWVCCDAAELPFASETFDAVTGSLVFCSLAQPERAMAEIARVLRREGRLVLLEHVRGERGVLRWLTDALERPWHALSRGCHLNRETERLVAAQGFVVARVSHHLLGLFRAIEAHKGAS